MNTTGTPTEPCSALAKRREPALARRIRNDRESSPTMPEDYQSPPPTPSPILTRAEVARRMALLADLQAELAARGVCSVLARTWRLVLRYNTGPWDRPGRPTRNCGYSGRTAPTWLPLTAELITLRTAGSARPTIRPAPPRPGRPPLDTRGGRSRYVQLHCHACQRNLSPTRSACR